MIITDEQLDHLKTLPPAKRMATVLFMLWSEDVIDDGAYSDAVTMALEPDTVDELVTGGAS